MISLNLRGLLRNRFGEVVETVGFDPHVEEENPALWRRPPLSQVEQTKRSTLLKMAQATRFHDPP
jgi:hypothetical protein